MLRFKQPLCQHSDGRLVPAGRAALAVQSPVFIVHTYEWQKGVDGSKKSYYGPVLKKTRLKTLKDKQETFSFSISSLSASFPFIAPSNKAGNTLEWQN